MHNNMICQHMKLKFHLNWLIFFPIHILVEQHTELNSEKCVLESRLTSATSRLAQLEKQITEIQEETERKVGHVTRAAEEREEAMTERMEKALDAMRQNYENSEECGHALAKYKYVFVIRTSKCWY